MGAKLSIKQKIEKQASDAVANLANLKGKFYQRRLDLPLSDKRRESFSHTIKALESAIATINEFQSIIFLELQGINPKHLEAVLKMDMQEFSMMDMLARNSSISEENKALKVKWEQLTYLIINHPDILINENFRRDDIVETMLSKAKTLQLNRNNGAYSREKLEEFKQEFKEKTNQKDTLFEEKPYLNQGT